MTKEQRKTLRLLRKAGQKAASYQTACATLSYQEMEAMGKLPSKLYSHCAGMAIAVKAAVGGDIVGGRVQGISHYWNRLPCGTEVDLTSCQFGGDGFTPFKKGRRHKLGLVNPRFLLFLERVSKEL